MSPRPSPRPRVRTLTLTTLEDRTVPSTVWTQRGGDSGHTSYVDVAFNPAGMTQSWTRTLDFPQSGTGSWDERAVAIDDRHVYRTDLEGYAPSGTYHVFAFNKDTGAEVWHRTFAAGAFEGVSEPSVANGFVFVNRAGHSGISGGTDADLPRIYGLNALTGATVMETRYAAQWGSNDRPAIDGTQLVTEDGYFGGISSYQIGSSSLPRQWNNQGWQLLKPMAAFDDQYVYAFNNVVFQRSNGARLADINHPTLMTESNPMVSQTGKVLFDVLGTVNGQSAYGVAAFDGNTHALLWTANTPGMVAAKAIGNGVVAVSSGTRLSLFNESDGSLLRTWTPPAGYTLTGEIVLTRTHAFVQSVGHYVATIHAIDLATGQQAWSYENRPADFSGAAMEMAMGGGQLVLSSYKFVRAFATDSAPVNQPPVANDDTGTTTEDTAVTVNALANDTDPDGDPLTVTGITQGANGSVTLNPDGTLTYTPAADWFGTDSFTYTVADDGGLTDTGTVQVTVSPVNDAPTFTPGGDVTVAEDSGPATIPGWATDIRPGPANESGQSLSFEVLAPNPSLFAVAPEISPTGTLTFTPAADANGSATVTVCLRDNGGTAAGGQDASPARTFTITVTPVPDVGGVIVNSGAAQRSRVTDMAVTFDSVVDPSQLAFAFSLTRADGLAVGLVHVTTEVINGHTTARLQFSGNGTEARSLADGLWTLRVRADRVLGSDGTPMAGDYTYALHRLFGDADGDRDVDRSDELKFNAAYGSRSNQPGYLSYFDWDQDVNNQGLRDIDQKDRTQFRGRLGRSI